LNDTTDDGTNPENEIPVATNVSVAVQSGTQLEIRLQILQAASMMPMGISLPIL